MTKNIPPEMKERYEEARRLIESSKDIKIYKLHTTRNERKIWRS